MKSKNLLSTLLALAIQVVVSGQTQGNQSSHRSLPDIGSMPELKISVSQQEKSQPKEKVYPKVISEETAVAKKSPPAIAVTSEPAVIDNNTYNYHNNSNCYATLTYAKELLKQADDLGMIEKTLRLQASAKTGAEKQQLVKAANELYKQAELKQIQASEITGKINIEKFKANEITFNDMALSTHATETILDNAKEINSEAKRSMKLAKEMREEAYAMSSNTAKLGSMNNAEDKENIALSKQSEAIGILKQYAALLELRNDLAIR